MAEREALTAEFVRQILNYSPETGALIWKERPASMFNDSVQSAAHNAASWNGRRAGMAAGTPTDHGYLSIRIHNRHYRAHRLAWIWMTGEWPVAEIDHRDGDRSNNSWSNLRPATRSQNAANARIQNNNTSGVKGVYWNKIARKWWAHVTKDGRRHSLGYFDDITDAIDAVTRGRLKHHGEYARMS